MSAGGRSAGLTRRQFLAGSAGVGAGLLLGAEGGWAMKQAKSRVAFLKTEDRKAGTISCLRALGVNPAKGKNVLVKPNFNTADEVPGSTHNDTLVALVEELWRMGAKSVTVGERSYPLTREVMEQKGVLPLLAKLDARVTDFDQLGARDWVEVRPKESHWREGFRIARPVLEAECLVSTGCLKTHQYGGVFTMSLKLHVGVVPTTRHGFGYMRELHGSAYQQEMIAEINGAFRPDLVLLDGIDVFVDGGPMTGKRAKGNVFLASVDRVAADAAGVAVLKSLGSNAAIMKPKIFEQRQLARAAALGLGAASASAVDLVPVDEESRPYADRVASLLRQG
jgi:uncharacterized protein (DUF362 family)